MLLFIPQKEMHSGKNTLGKSSAVSCQHSVKLFKSQRDYTLWTHFGGTTKFCLGKGSFMPQCLICFGQAEGCFWSQGTKQQFKGFLNLYQAFYSPSELFKTGSSPLFPAVSPFPSYKGIAQKIYIYQICTTRRFILSDSLEA